jgi:hypothetical protein
VLLLCVTSITIDHSEHFNTLILPPPISKLGHQLLARSRLVWLLGFFRGQGLSLVFNENVEDDAISPGSCAELNSSIKFHIESIETELQNLGMSSKC